MKQFLIFAFASLLPLVLAPSASAASERSFVGLWEGIDPVDGGDSLRSITCLTDETCNLAATDSVITLCGGGTGFASGTCSPVRTARRCIWRSAMNAISSLVETAVVGGATTLPNIIFHKVSR